MKLPFSELGLSISHRDFRILGENHLAKEFHYNSSSVDFPLRRWVCAGQIVLFMLSFS